MGRADESDFAFESVATRAATSSSTELADADASLRINPEDVQALRARGLAR